MEAFDDALDEYYNTLDKVNECRMCGKAIYDDKEYCSKSCFDADF